MPTGQLELHDIVKPEAIAASLQVDPNDPEDAYLMSIITSATAGLPPGWVIVRTKDGKVVFKNLETRQTSDDFPLIPEIEYAITVNRKARRFLNGKNLERLKRKAFGGWKFFTGVQLLDKEKEQFHQRTQELRLMRLTFLALSRELAAHRHQDKEKELSKLKAEIEERKMRELESQAGVSFAEEKSKSMEQKFLEATHKLEAATAKREVEDRAQKFELEGIRSQCEKLLTEVEHARNVDRESKAQAKKLEEERDAAKVEVTKLQEEIRGYSSEIAALKHQLLVALASVQQPQQLAEKPSSGSGELPAGTDKTESTRPPLLKDIEAERTRRMTLEMKVMTTMEEEVKALRSGKVGNADGTPLSTVASNSATGQEKQSEQQAATSPERRPRSAKPDSKSLLSERMSRVIPPFLANLKFVFEAYSGLSKAAGRSATTTSIGKEDFIQFCQDFGLECRTLTLGKIEKIYAAGTMFHKQDKNIDFYGFVWCVIASTVVAMDSEPLKHIYYSASLRAGEVLHRMGMDNRKTLRAQVFQIVEQRQTGQPPKPATLDFSVLPETANMKPPPNSKVDAHDIIAYQMPTLEQIEGWTKKS